MQKRILIKAAEMQTAGEAKKTTYANTKKKKVQTPCDAHTHKRTHMVEVYGYVAWRRLTAGSQSLVMSVCGLVPLTSPWWKYTTAGQ